MEGRGSVDLEITSVEEFDPSSSAFLAGARSGWSFRFMASEPVITRSMTFAPLRGTSGSRDLSSSPCGYRAFVMEYLTMNRATSNLLLGALFSSAAVAQIVSGTLVGNVTDATGSVVPKASVTATNESTGRTRSTLTDDSGYF